MGIPGNGNFREREFPENESKQLENVINLKIFCGNVRKCSGIFDNCQNFSRELSGYFDIFPGIPKNCREFSGTLEFRALIPGFEISKSLKL